MELNLFTAAETYQQLNEVKAVYQKNPNVKQITIKSAEDTAEMTKELWPVDINHREAMMVIYLNNSNKTLGYSILSIGSITGTLVDVRLVFQTALLTNATAIIMAHNHPSGTLRPSTADNQVTNKIKDAGKFLDIRLLDHLIITEESYFSYANEGLLS